jgi:magnesium-transporting ATPase (P-type)
MAIVKPAAEAVSWYTLSADAATQRLGVSPDQGLGAEEVTRRLAEYGPNELPTEPPPSRWEVARGQLTNPMNVMLLIVGVASLVIGQVATAVVVLALVAFNVIMGSNQELKARASVEALAQLQVPRAERGVRARSRRSSPPTWCPGTWCCSKRATSYRRTGGSSPRPHSRCRRPRSPGRARR